MSSESSRYLELSLFDLIVVTLGLSTIQMVLLAKIFCQRQEQHAILSFLVSNISTGKDVGSLCLILRCIFVICDENQCNDHIAIVTACLSHIQGIFGSVDKGETILLRYAARVVRCCSERVCEARMSSGIDDENLECVQAFVSTWSQFATSWIRSCIEQNHVLAVTPILVELIKSLAPMMEAFPEYCSEVFATATHCACTLLCAIRDDQIRRNREVSSSLDQGYSTDGDRLDNDMLALHLFEMLCVGLSDEGGARLLHENLDRLVVMLTEFMQLTSDQREQLSSEGNEFVAAEEDDCCDVSLRQSGVEIFTEVCKSCSSNPSIFSSLFSIVGRELQAALLTYGQTAAGGGTVATATVEQAVFKVEGVLWTLSAIGTRYMKVVGRARRARASGAGRKAAALEAALTAAPASGVVSLVGGMLQSLLQGGVGPSGASPVLQARALSLFAIFSELFPPAAQDAAAGAGLALAGSAPLLALRLQGCRAVSKIVRSVLRSCGGEAGGGGDGLNVFSAAFVRAAVDAFAALAPLCDANTIHFPVEGMAVVISSNQAALADPSMLDLLEKISVVGVGVWNTFPSDGLVTDVVGQMFSALLRIRSEEGVRILANSLLPMVGRVMAAQAGASVSLPLPLVLEALVGHLARVGVACCVHGAQSGSGALAAINVNVLKLVADLARRSHGYEKHDCLQAANKIMSRPGVAAAVGAVASSPSSAVLEDGAAFPSVLLSGAVSAITSSLSDSSTADCTGAAVGTFCHVVLNFSAGFSEADVAGAFAALVTTLAETQSQYVRYSITMGLVHLFARNAEFTARMISLVQMAPREGAPGALGLTLNMWRGLHVSVGSLYCQLVSSFGLLRLTELLSKHEANHAFAKQVLELLLSGLPEVLAEREDGWLDGSDGGASEGDPANACDDDNSEDEDEWEEGDDEGGEDGGWEQAGGGAAVFAAAGGKGEGPFAPAEMYLSDAIPSLSSEHSLGGGDSLGDPLFVKVSDHLVFSPPACDPLAHTDLEAQVVAVLQGMQDRTTGAVSCFQSCASLVQCIVGALWLGCAFCCYDCCGCGCGCGCSLHIVVRDLLVRLSIICLLRCIPLVDERLVPGAPAPRAGARALSMRHGSRSDVHEVCLAHYDRRSHGRANKARYHVPAVHLHISAIRLANLDRQRDLTTRQWLRPRVRICQMNSNWFSNSYMKPKN